MNKARILTILSLVGFIVAYIIGFYTIGQLPALGPAILTFGILYFYAWKAKKDGNI